MADALVSLLGLIIRRPNPSVPRDVEEFVRRARGGPIVHRAGQPENTLAAIRRAKEEGAVGVEIDVMLTRDDRCVLLHDDTVDRTSNGSGRVRDMTLEELRQLRFGEELTELIPTLEEAVSLCEKLDLIVFLDAKPFKTAEDLQKLLRLFEENPLLYRRVCIISFYITALYRLRRMDPNAQCGLCVYCNSLVVTVDGLERTSLWAKVLSPLVDWVWFNLLDHLLLNFVGVNTVLFCKDDILTRRVNAETWSSGSRNLFVWTVNRSSEKQSFQEKNIPFFTDSAVRDVSEAWTPPTLPQYKKLWRTLDIVLLATPLLYLLIVVR